MEHYKLKPDIMLQEFNGEYYVIDMTNQKTYAVNEEGYRILSEILDNPMTAGQIYQNLGGTDPASAEVSLITDYLQMIKHDLKVLE